MKKKNIIKIVIAVVIVAVVGGGYYYYTKTANAAKAKTAVKYTTVKAKKGTIDVTIQATGTVSAATSDDIISFNNGIISNIKVKEGDMVKKGQTIGFVNDTTLQQSVNLADLKVQQDNINIANNKDANKVDSNNLQLQQDQADLNSKTAQLAKETVTSPIDGVIVTMAFKNGDTVQSGKTIATVVDMKSLQINAQVDELDISNVKNGQKATIKFDALTGKSYTGTVTKVAELGKTTNNVTNYDVYIAIDNPDGIKIGMNGNINIAVASKDNVITLSLDAVQNINGKKYVLTSIPTTTSGNVAAKSSSTNSAKTMGTSNMKEITTGLTNQTDVEILSGLADGDTAYIKMTTVSSTSTTSSRSKTSSTSNLGAASGTSNFGGGGSMPQGGEKN